MKWFVELPRRDLESFDAGEMDELGPYRRLRLRYCLLIGFTAAILVISLPSWLPAVLGFTWAHWPWFVIVPIALVLFTTVVAEGAMSAVADAIAGVLVAGIAVLAIVELEGIWSFTAALRSWAPAFPLWLLAVALLAGFASTWYARSNAESLVEAPLVIAALAVALTLANFIWRAAAPWISRDDLARFLREVQPHWPPVALSVCAVLVVARFRSAQYRRWAEHEDDYDGDVHDPLLRFADSSPTKWHERLTLAVRRAGVTVGDLVLAVLTIALFGATALYYLPGQLIDTSGLSPDNLARARTDERRTVLAVLATLGAGITLIYTHLRHQLDRDAINTGRYSEGVQQLGSENVSTQLGGIYALGRVARDSPSDADSIIEVLATYARETANERHPYPEDVPISPTTMAALHVLARTPATAKPPDLRGVNLSWAVVEGMRFRPGTNLTAADLREAKVSGARLVQTDLSRAKLQGASLVDVDLDRVTLNAADLTGVHLKGCTMAGARVTETSAENAHFEQVSANNATLRGCILTNARFSHVYLSGADLSESNLSGLVMYGGTLDRADLTDAVLRGARITETGMEHCYLHGADLREAHLQDVDLGRADLTEADVRGTNLRHALLGRTRLDQIKWDASTIWPDGFDADRLAALSPGGKLADGSTGS